jgi:hypothetical protein
MKKVFAGVAVAALMMTAVHAANVSSFATEISSVTMEDGWMKSESQTFTGMHNNVKTWYKVNTKDATVWWSTDGKTWAQVMDGMWQDKEGKWMKINAGKLVWSADGGKTWVEVPEWKWQDADGTWCKYDKDWTLWTKKGM